MTDVFLKSIANDCGILLARALSADKEISCFGIDGFGQHGTSDRAQSYPVTAIELLLDANNDNTFPDGKLIIRLGNYNAAKFGHILTDQNFMHSFNGLLRAQSIDSSCWEWGTLEEQEEDGIVLNLDVEKLLGI